MRSYITGSRAYGTPREDSDIDLVVVLTVAEAKMLWSLSDASNVLRFGRLNLVAFVETEKGLQRYQAWREVHESLVARRPVSKQECCIAFESRGFKRGVSGGARVEEDQLVDVDKKGEE